MEIKGKELQVGDILGKRQVVIITVRRRERSMATWTEYYNELEITFDDASIIKINEDSRLLIKRPSGDSDIGEVPSPPEANPTKLS